MRHSRLFILFELLAAVTFLTLQALGFLSASIFYLFGISWFSLWLRKSSWRQHGLRRPASWLHTILIGIVVGVVYQAISIGLVLPLLVQITNEPLDLSQFRALHNNPSQLILWLGLSWTIGAFLEEMVFRGYLLNRAADLFSDRRYKWVIGLIVSSALFALGHAYQGIAGILENFLFGCVMAGVYLLRQRSLWPVIIAHGVYDTIAIVLIFFGLYP